MNQDQALDQLMRTNYAPAFTKRCAERGLNIQTEPQLVEALETAAQLKTAQHMSSGQDDLIHKASHSLNSALYGEEEAQKIASARQAQAGGNGPPPKVTKEAKEALAVLLSGGGSEESGEQQS